ncbi:CKLF-like MARVEL transmembrane domain-containing protein 6 [Neosynchiropus ocellatus]
MDTGPVYPPTTIPNGDGSWFLLPNDYLNWTRAAIKAAQVVLSLVAFILEETVTSCIKCGPLYFFEFVSCSALLFTLLLLTLLSTALHRKVGVSCWPQLDFVYTALTTLLFFISSTVFAATNSGRSMEVAAVVFGFLATAAFLLDVVLTLRTPGFPFKKQPPGKPAGNGPEAEPSPEREELAPNNA